MQKTILFIFALLFLSACNESAEAPDFNDGIDGQDNISPDPTPTPGPGPTPTPTPAPPISEQTLKFLPSDLNPDDANLVYKNRVKQTQLALPIDDEDCHYKYKQKCIKDRQVLFQFDIEKLNKDFPADLWDVTHLSLKASYYSVSGNISEELLCLLNRKVCSGVEITKLGGIRLPFLWRNSRFWTGADREHVVNTNFDKALRAGINANGVAVRTNKVFDLIKLFALTPKSLLTTTRKNPSLHFSVTSDTYVEQPELTIKVKRRLLSE